MVDCIYLQAWQFSATAVGGSAHACKLEQQILTRLASRIKTQAHVLSYAWGVITMRIFAIHINETAGHIASTCTKSGSPPNSVHCTFLPVFLFCPARPKHQTTSIVPSCRPSCLAPIGLAPCLRPPLLPSKLPSRLAHKHPAFLQAYPPPLPPSEAPGAYALSLQVSRHAEVNI